MKEKKNNLSKYVRILILTLLFQVSNTTYAAIWCQDGRCGFFAGSCIELETYGQGFADGMICWSIFDNSGEATNVSRLLINSDNKAVFDIDGKIVSIVSDKMERVLQNFLNSKEILDADKFKKRIDQLYKIDDGVVSQERLESIARRYNAKVIKVDKLPKANFCPPCKDKKGVLKHK